MIQKGDPLNLTGKVAVITGAGSGIGLGVAQMLSAYGASVAIVDVSPKSEAAAQELRDAGRDAAFFQCDVTNEQSVIDTVTTAHRYPHHLKTGHRLSDNRPAPVHPEQSSFAPPY